MTTEICFRLRHVTHGYWKVIAEFTHKNIVKEIDRIQNITTDLGRGECMNNKDITIIRYIFEYDMVKLYVY